MIYLVSGYMRSMTSAMMRALVAGGMDAHFNPERDDFFTKTFATEEGYHPNKTGFFELSIDEIRAIGFPKGLDGKLIKILYEGVGHLAVNPDGYRVIIMVRDPVEIWWSYVAFFGVPPPFTQHTTEDTKFAYRMLIQNLHEMCLNRRDVKSVHLVSAKALAKTPKQVFSDLHAAGWPVDVESAAASILPNTVRSDVATLPQEINWHVGVERHG